MPLMTGFDYELCAMLATAVLEEKEQAFTTLQMIRENVTSDFALGAPNPEKVIDPALSIVMEILVEDSWLDADKDKILRLLKEVYVESIVADEKQEFEQLQKNNPEMTLADIIDSKKITDYFIAAFKQVLKRYYAEQDGPIN